MKPLKPSMKENKRYLLVKGEIEDIEEAIFEFIGVLGMSKAGLNWIKKDKKAAILSINRDMLEPIRASFAIWKNEIRIEKISGTLKGLRKK